MKLFRTLIIGSFFFACVFSSNRSSAQSLDSLAEVVRALYKEGNFSGALSKAKEMSVIASTGTNSAARGNCRMWEATIYKKIKEFDKAEAAYFEAIKFYEQDTSDSLQNVAYARNILGVMYDDLGKTNEAEQEYLTALSIYRKKPGILSEEYTLVQENLVQLYSNAGDLKKLIVAYEASVTNKKAHPAGKDSTYASMANILGLLYQKNNDLDRALIYFNEARNTWEISTGIHSNVYLSALLNLKQAYDLRGNPDSALAVTIQIKEVKAETSGSQNTSYALTLNDLAVYYLNAKKYTSAEPYFKESIEILKLQAGEDDLNYNVVLSNLATLYARQQNAAMAIPIYEKLVENYKHRLPETNFQYGNVLNLLGVALIDTGKEALAIPLLEEALRVWRGDSSLVNKTDKITDNLAIAYKNTKRYDQLKNLYFSRLKTLPAEGDEAARGALLNLVAILYEDSKQTDTAVIYYLKSIDAYRKSAASPLSYTTVYNNLGSLYSKNENYKSAINCYKELLLGLSAGKLENSREYAYYSNVLAVVYHSDQQYVEAAKHYQDAVKAYLILGGAQDKGYIQALSNLAVAESAMDHFQEAERLNLSVIDLSLKASGDTSKMYIEALNTAGDLYYKIDSNEKALDYYGRAEKLAGATGNWRLHNTSLKNLASGNAAILNYDRSIQQYLEVIRVKVQNGDTVNREYTSTLNALALVYARKSDYRTAEGFYSKALQINNGQQYSLTEYIYSTNGKANLFRYQGKYAEAEAFYLKALNAANKRWGDTSLTASTYLNNLAVLYDEMGALDKALKYYTMAAGIVKKQVGTDHLDYATCLSNLGLIAHEMGDYKKAEAYYLEGAAIRLKKIPFSSQYAESLHNLGAFYDAIGIYAKSEPYLLQSLDLYKKLTGTHTLNYAQSLAALSNLYDNMGQFEKALEQIDRALLVKEEILGKNSLQYAQSLNIKGGILVALSRFKAAEDTFLECLHIRKEILGDQHPEYGATVMALAELYRQSGMYEQALPLYQTTLALYKKVFGMRNSRYATAMNNLGLLYTAMGKFNLAEPLYLDAKDIWKALQGENSLDYALSLNNLAVFYSDLGQYEKSMGFFKQSADIRKILLGEEHPQYAEVLSNMGILKSTLGLQKDAEELQLQALEITKKAIGTLSKSYAVRLNNLASVYMEEGDYPKAEIYFKEAVDLWLQLTGEANPEYAVALNNLGVLYSKSGQFDKAMEAYLNVKSLRKKYLGESHQDYANIMDNLYRQYLNKGDITNAEICLQKMGDITIHNLSSTFMVLSEKEKGLFLSSKISLLEDFNSFLLIYPQASAQTRQTAFNLLLKLKSLTLSETKNVLDKLKSSTDTTVTDLYQRWLSGKSYLASQYRLPKESQDKDLKILEERSENMEKELTRRSGTFETGKKAAVLTYQDVQKNLSKDEAAVEFVSFNLYNKNWTDSIMYAAYLLRPGDTVPQFIPLCEAKKLHALFTSAGKNATAMVKSFYRGLELENSGAGILGDSLYNMVWKPLEPYLNGIQRIAYAPAGKLYAVAFNALPMGDNKLLIDKYKLSQYTSTRDLVFRNREGKFAAPENITLFGDATFTLDSLQLAASQQKAAPGNTPGTLPAARGTNHQVWGELPGTLQEVNKIKALFDARKISAVLFTKTAATEQIFKQLNNRSPRILHLATHGFFLPEPDKKTGKDGVAKFALAEDPLMRSGLVLAGGNYAWAGNTPLKGIEDGILTAYEISQLNLENTGLVVLSACETALGDIKGSEGVFGLQRSFKLAGVKKLIVSLWQVPDKETAELMTVFYTNLFKGMNTNEAFNTAQAAMRKKYTPYYWAAFVLVE